MNAGSFIQARSLSKTYSSGPSLVRALSDVDFSVDEGQFTVVAGPSGSGKSTLLNLLAGLDTPSSGEIEVAGARISGLAPIALARYRRFAVGMIFQSFNLIASRTALENVELPLIFSGIPKKQRRERALELIGKVGLGPRAHHRPTELSGGEQQRVAVARALANHPRVVMADEPTGNLDSQTSREILRLLSELNQKNGLTIVMVSHEEALVREFAHGIVRLRDGRVAAREVWA
jgi:putative ABC transport system ATP-binding protein